MIVNMHEAKTNLSKYVEKALAGEEVLLARAGEPVVALVPLGSLAREKRNNVILGVMERAFEVPDDFDEPLADEMVDAFSTEARRVSTACASGTVRSLHVRTGSRFASVHPNLGARPDSQWCDVVD